MRPLLVLAALALMLTSCMVPSALADEAPEGTVSKAIPEPEKPSQMLIESFMDSDANEPEWSDKGVHLSWWPWSDETGSNWPDDDAKSRLGQLGLPGEPATVYNGEATLANASELQYLSLIHI